MMKNKSGSKPDTLERKATHIARRRLTLGLLLAPGAPVSWLALRWAMGGGAALNLVEELSTFWVLYTYLLLGAAVSFMTFGYYLGRAEAQVLKEHQKALHGSRTDRLTGLLNAAGLSEALSQLTAFVNRKPAPLSLVRVSIDQTADFARLDAPNRRDALRLIAAALRKGRRAEDIVGRLSGLEFAVVAPGADQAGVLVVANNILAQVKKLNVEVNGRKLELTASAGAATLITKEPSSLLVSRAGRALAAARRVGGNYAVGSYEAEVKPAGARANAHKVKDQDQPLGASAVNGDEEQALQRAFGDIDANGAGDTSANFTDLAASGTDIDIDVDIDEDEFVR